MNLCLQQLTYPGHRGADGELMCVKDGRYIYYSGLASATATSTLNAAEEIAAMLAHHFGQPWHEFVFIDIQNRVTYHKHEGWWCADTIVFTDVNGKPSYRDSEPFARCSWPGLLDDADVLSADALENKETFLAAGKRENELAGLRGLPAHIFDLFRPILDLKA